MLDLKSELVNFPQINPERLAGDSKEANVNIRNAVELYNKALESLRTNSEDIAIIGLKKALSLYPDFIEARTLLGLCYLYVNDYRLAAEMFKKAAKDEEKGGLAQGYLKSIAAETGSGGSAEAGIRLQAVKQKTDKLADGAKKTKSKKSPAERKSKKQDARTQDAKTQDFKTQNIEVIKQESHFKRESQKFVEPFRYKADKSGVKRPIKSFAAGALLTAVVSVVVLVAGLSFGTGDGDEGQKVTAESYRQLEEQYNRLSSDYNELKKQLESANNEIRKLKLKSSFTEAENLILERKYEQAADLLIALKNEDLAEEDRNKCQGLLDKCIVQACQAVYNSGIQLFNAGKYKEASEKLAKLKNYNYDYAYLNYALYCLGKCYDSLNDSKSAIETFQLVIDKFPGSDYAIWSRNKINEIMSRQ